MSNNNKLNLWQKLKRLLTMAAPHSVIRDADTIDTPIIDSNNRPNRAIDTQSNAQPDFQPRARDDINTNTNPNTDNDGADKENTHKGQSSDNETVHADARTDVQTPIIDYLKDYFRNKHWHYTHYRPKVADSQQSHHIALRIKNKQVDCGYLCRVQEGNSLLAVYGILPFSIPESHQSAAMLLITQMNYDMLIGNLEMDVNDGEVRYKNAMDIDVVGMDDTIIEYLLQSVIAMTTISYEIFDDLINTQNPSDDMPTLLAALRQQAAARMYFLPTQKMQ